MSKGKSVAIVGATGAVGQEIFKVLKKRDFPMSKLTMLASAKSVGTQLDINDEIHIVQELTADSFVGVDIALFSAGGAVSKKFAPIAAKSGCVVIDNSSAFRLDAGVPLVVPEINPDAALAHSGIIANPNCTTIISLMALYPLHKTFGLQRVFASSYQAVSGSGNVGIEELDRQTAEWCQGKDLTCEEYDHPIAGNVIPLIGAAELSDYSVEEEKLQSEGRKILNLPELRASITCMRAPVHRAHTVDMSAEFKHRITAETAREVLNNAPGIVVIDDPREILYPHPSRTK